ncbi:MAG: photosystem II assembly family protein [Vulcanococcus sp.]
MVPPVREPLDPALRARLLQESRPPGRGRRRALWLAFTASAGLGLATMAMRASAGEAVPGSDLLIQVVALVLFGGLLWRDRGVVDDRSDLR